MTKTGVLVGGKYESLAERRGCAYHHSSMSDDRRCEESGRALTLRASLRSSTRNKPYGLVDFV